MVYYHLRPYHFYFTIYKHSSLPYAAPSTQKEQSVGFPRTLAMASNTEITCSLMLEAAAGSFEALLKSYKTTR
jgi:hypothetical protein